MDQACGCCTTPMMVLRARQPAQQTPTSLLSTPWTVNLTTNDGCARIKSFLGSAWQSDTNLQLLVLPDDVGLSITAFFLTSGLILALILDASLPRNKYLTLLKGYAPAGVSGSSPSSMSSTGAHRF